METSPDFSLNITLHRLSWTTLLRIITPTLPILLYFFLLSTFHQHTFYLDSYLSPTPQGQRFLSVLCLAESSVPKTVPDIG